MSFPVTVIAVVFLVALASPWSAAEETAGEKPLRAGIIGLDTSHVMAFTELFHDPKAEGAVARVKVVAGYPGGTDIPASKDRVGKITGDLRAAGAEIVDSIPALLARVDVVLVESVDGRPHLEQVRPVLEARKPVFIDKPVAGSLADAIAIFDLAKKHGVPCFSSSSLRFSPGILSMRQNPEVGDVVGCDVWGPCPVESTHPDLFWYGIHGVEMLFTIMGTGCERVARARTEGTDVVTGTWKDGRVGVFRGIRQGKADYGAMVFGSKGIAPSGGYSGYRPLVEEIARFFATGKAPVSAEETIEIFAFMEAADESKRRGGEPVTLESVLAKAREAARGGSQGG
jgi:predicted dehydrogenase